MRRCKLRVLLRHLNELLIVLVQKLYLSFGKTLDVDQPIARTFDRRNQFIQF